MIFEKGLLGGGSSGGGSIGSCRYMEALPYIYIYRQTSSPHKIRNKMKRKKKKFPITYSHLLPDAQCLS